MQAQKLRPLLSGSSYNKYFQVAKLQNTNPIINQSGDVFDTILEIENIVQSTLADTAAIARTLAKTKLEDTLENVWNFVYQHIQYKLDETGVEQLRRPLRTWKDRKNGVDCDCYSIFICSILSNLRINHTLRMAKYNGKDYFQHIYVIVPQPNGGYYTLDCVVDAFDYEVPFSQKHDKKMMPIQYLNGLDPVNTTSQVKPKLPAKPGFGMEFIGIGTVAGLGTLSTPELVYHDFLASVKLHLQNTLALIKSNPAMMGDKGLFQSRVAYVLARWDQPELRDKALDELARLEEMGLAGIGLGGLWSSIKKGASAVGNAVKNTVQAVGTGVKNAAEWTANKVTDAAKATATGVKNATEFVADKTVDAAKATATGVKNAVNWTGVTIATGASATWTGIKNAAEWTADKAGDAAKAVAEVAKDVGQAIIRYNPLSIVIRNGLLLAFKVNLFRMAERLGYGYWTEEQAKAKGLDMGEFAQVKDRLKKVQSIFNGLQGEEDSLKKNILLGWEHGTKKHDLPQLGEPVTATATAAAMPIITTIIAFLSSVNWDKLFALLQKKPNYSADDQNAGIDTNYPTEAEILANPEKYGLPPNSNANSLLPILGIGLVAYLIFK
ncbi:hypothetical protein [Adhaeribacter pallidiroseus]|uniref:Transglutaminase-like domain-containing protein n=1 Tax=Adhaeribacter pallidiroseus TaxID=2072847 RepID=A0A369QSB2_9BACT|nr:hypothetical protein [Adhaeribacter pallidiroseus]RDC65058.1 hypothetical protein AHMF7616_03681 [Adhaeribacter pallidiroseus]